MARNWFTARAKCHPNRLHAIRLAHITERLSLHRLTRTLVCSVTARLAARSLFGSLLGSLLGLLLGFLLGSRVSARCSVHCTARCSVHCSLTARSLRGSVDEPARHGGCERTWYLCR